MAFLKTIGKAVISGVSKPTYTVIRTDQGVEERHYPPAKWVSTEVKNSSHNDARDIAFKRLFKYITGENMDGKNIDMTAPVVTKVIPGKGPNSESTFIVSFFIPPSHHSEPPSPSNPDVYIEEFPDLTVYTIAFSGFAKDKDFNEEAAISTDKTKEKSVHEEFYYTAGYDSPMKLINRTNEVWFVMKE